METALIRIIPNCKLLLFSLKICLTDRQAYFQVRAFAIPFKYTVHLHGFSELNALVQVDDNVNKYLIIHI